jgi:hypothetical protein
MANLGVLSTFASAKYGSNRHILSTLRDTPKLSKAISAASANSVAAPTTYTGTYGKQLYGKIRTSNYVLYSELIPQITLNSLLGKPIGRHKIAGTVRIEGIYSENIRVNLYRHDIGLLVGTTVTDSTGNFEFLYIPFTDCTFFVMAFYNGFNAVVMDNITPVLM